MFLLGKIRTHIWKIIAIIAIFALIGIGVTVFSLSTPYTEVEIKMVDISPDEMLLNVSVRVENPNIFPLTVRELKVEVFGEKGGMGEFSLPNRKIPSQKSRTFYGNYHFSSDNEVPEKLTVIINGKVGTNIVGIKKLMMMKNRVNILLSPIQKISPPTINFQGGIEEINESGVILHYLVSIHNPNFYSLSCKNLFLSIKDENGNIEILNTSLLKNLLIPSNETIETDGNIILPLEIMNFDNITTHLKGKVGIKAGGIEKEMDIESVAKIKVPKIKELIKIPAFKTINKLENLEIVSNIPPIVDIKTNISIEINNQNAFTIEVEDIAISLYAVHLLNEEKIGEGFIAGKLISGNETKILSGTFSARIALVQFWPPIPKTELHFHVETKIGTKKVNQKIPIEINFYQVVGVS